MGKGLSLQANVNFLATMQKIAADLDGDGDSPVILESGSGNYSAKNTTSRRAKSSSSRSPRRIGFTKRSTKCSRLFNGRCAERWKPESILSRAI